MTSRPLLATVAIATSLLAFVVVQSTRRSNELGGAMRFVPQDADVVITAQSIETVWRLLEAHVRRITAGTTCGETGLTQLRQFLMKLRCEPEVPTSLEGLRKVGLDTSRSAAISFNLIDPGHLKDPLPNLNPALVLPVGDRAKLEGWLKKSEGRIHECSTQDAKKDPACVAFVDDDYAVIMLSNQWARVREMTADSKWRTNDTLAELRSEAMGSRPDAAAPLGVFIASPVPVAVVLAGNHAKLTMRARARFGPPVSNLQRSFLDPIGGDEALAIVDNVPVAIALMGENLGGRLSYLKAFAPDRWDSLNQVPTQSSYSFQPILPALAESRSLTSLAIAITDFDRSVPRTAIVAREGSKRSQTLIAELQLANARRRYEMLRDRIASCIRHTEASSPAQLKGDECKNAAALPEAAPATAAEITLAHKEMSGNDAAEFLVGDGKLPQLDELFAGDSYAGCLEAAHQCPSRRRYRYVAPRYNANDFEWLLNKPEPEDQRRLRNGTYRIVSLYDDTEETLWFALDIDTLKLALASVSEGVPATRRGSLLRFKLNPKFLWAQTLHSGDALDRLARTIADIRDYRSFEVTVTPLGEHRGVLMEGVLEY